jgi:hypothetical protein
MKLPPASSGVSSSELNFFRRKRRGIYPERLNNKKANKINPADRYAPADFFVAAALRATASILPTTHKTV